MYASQMAKSDHASYILCAHWLGDNNQTIDLHAACRPGQVQYYIKHNVVLKRSSEETPMSFLLTFTEWYKQHPEKNYLLSPVTLWSPDFVRISEASFLPICRIVGRCMQLKISMKFSRETIQQWRYYCYSPIGCANLVF